MTTISAQPDPILAQLRKGHSCFYRIQSNYYHRCTNLGKRLSSLFKMPSWEHQKGIIIDALYSKSFTFRKFPLRRILAKLESLKLSELIQEVLKKDEKNIERLLSLITSDELLKVVQETNKEITWKSEDLKVQMLVDASKALSTVNVHANSSSRSIITRAILRFLDTLFKAFSFFAIGREPGSSWEASYMLDVYAKLFALPFLIATLLNGLLGVPALAVSITIGIFILVVILATIYVRKRPCSDNIPSCVNLTLKAKNNELPAVLGRDSECELLINHIQSSSQSVRVHPIIVGDPGCGKTELISLLAQRLKDKKVFLVNTAELHNDSFSYDATHNKVQRIMHSIGKHKKDVVIVFDEAQAAFREGSDLWQRLKTVLDSLPYCIAITTPEDYKKHFDFQKKENTKIDSAYGSRFVKFDLAHTDAEQTKLILFDILNREAPELPIPPTVLSNIMEKATQKTGRASPGGASRLLVQLIALIRRELTNAEESQERKDFLNKQRTDLAEFYNFFGNEAEKECIKKLLDPNQKVPASTSQAKISSVKLKELGTNIKFCKEQLLTIAKNWKETESQKKQWLFANYFTLPSLRKQIPDITEISTKMVFSLN